jgi:hypothetical protein
LYLKTGKKKLGLIIEAIAVATLVYISPDRGKKQSKLAVKQAILCKSRS